MNMKKVAYFRKIEEIIPYCHLPSAKTTQTVKIMFSNVAFKPTVYKTGGQVKKSGQLQNFRRLLAKRKAVVLLLTRISSIAGPTLSWLLPHYGRKAYQNAPNCVRLFQGQVKKSGHF